MSNSSDDKVFRKVFWILAFAIVLIGCWQFYDLLQPRREVGNCELALAPSLGDFTPVVVVSVALLLLAMFIAVGWLIVNVLDFDSRDPHSTELVFSVILPFALLILIFANLYKMFGIVPPDGQAIPSNLDYLYFSIVTFTTLGYGDFSPCPNTRFVSAAQALLGFMYYPFVVVVIIKFVGFRKGAD